MALLSLFQSKKESTGIFIPKENGFVELEDVPASESINDIASHLGYNTDQFYVHNSYFGPEIEPVRSVIFELFTQNIIYVLTTKAVTKLKQSQLTMALRTFKFSDSLDSYTVAGNLDNAITNRSMPVEFLARVLDLKDAAPNGIFYTPKLDLHLYFNDGYLTDYQSADGLRTAARYWKQYDPYMLGCFEIEAQIYWGDDVGKILGIAKLG